MMNIQKSDIVVPLNGRDTGKLFLVADIAEEYAMLVDGKGRRLEKPKKKKMRHIRLVAKSDCRAAVKLRSGEKISNSEIRRSLSEFSDGIEGEEGGM